MLMIRNLPEGRTAQSKLRRWCPEAKTHQDDDDPICGWNHGTDDSHRLRLRRMLECSECDQGYFAVTAFDKHECYSAY